MRSGNAGHLLSHRPSKAWMAKRQGEGRLRLWDIPGTWGEAQPLSPSAAPHFSTASVPRMGNPPQFNPLWPEKSGSGNVVGRDHGLGVQVDFWQVPARLEAEGAAQPGLSQARPHQLTPGFSPAASFRSANTRISANTKISATAAAHPRQALGKSTPGAACTRILGGGCISSVTQTY